MTRFFLLITAVVFATTTTAQTISPLEGFAYGKQDAPRGYESQNPEWESPTELSLNKEQPKAWFFHFNSEESARKVLPENSAYYQSLDGVWKFNWVGNPEERPTEFYKPDFDVSAWDDVEVPMNWNVYGLQNDGSQKYGTPIYVNQPVIFKHSVAVGDWKGGVMREPAKHHTTYKNRNEVGSYRRTFTLPAEWDGREVYINFDGVDSFFYLWINGQYVGFSKNSRNLAAFNITSYLVKGENTVAVEVYRSSDASFLESQDMFRLPGIFRTVSLTATNPVEIRDLRVTTDLDAEYKNAKANIAVDIRNLTSKVAKGYRVLATIYKNELYSDENTPLNEARAITPIDITEPSATTTATLSIDVENPAKWSAEEPNRYTLVVSLLNKKGNIVERASTHFGFREVELLDTKAEDDEFGLAGRYYYLNGKPIKMKGVNRHENNLERGHAITREQMHEEVMLMLRGNINHVRCSHYPNAPYWYYLCDKYGIMLEDEANLESHQYYYGDASLSHVEEFKNAHIARIMEMAHATVNHPSVVIWSLGNEAGPGKNFVAAYNELKAFDSTRPVQYERNNNIVDIGSNQYPSIGWTQYAVTGKAPIKYPFHISEYAHSMGNAVGNLQDYWDAIESTNFFMGGAIWDWADQAFWNVDKQSGVKYMGYGGDFGDRPNDHTFCMNGIIFPDHTPKPQYYEVKKVYQNAGISMLDNGEICIFNKRYFTSLNDLDVVVSLWEDGKEIERYTQPNLNISPRTRKSFKPQLHTADLKADKEYFIKVQLLLSKDMPWAKKGYVQMEEQMLLKAATKNQYIAQAASTSIMPSVTTAGKTTTISGGDAYTIEFNNETGALHSLTYNGTTVLNAGNSMQLYTYRAPVDNDNWAFNRWFALGLFDTKDKALSMQTTGLKADGTIVIQYIVRSQATHPGRRVKNEDNSFTLANEEREMTDEDFHFISNRIWTIYPDGSIELNSVISGSDSSISLARMGYQMQLSSDLTQYTYYGRGPQNNYNDRSTGAFIEQHRSTVKEQFVHFPKPQDMANREDVRWAALTNKAGNGILVVSTEGMSTSALEWNSVELTEAAHPFQLPASSGTWLNIDKKVNGLGGNSCGQGGPLAPDVVKSGENSVGFIIRPIKSGDDYSAKANVLSSGATPVMVSRSVRGVVTMSCTKADAEIYYKVGDKGKATLYTEPVDMSQGGDITVWEKSTPELEARYTFSEVTSIPISIAFCSSQETGDDAENLIDGDPSTIWHTMYSVTVANYPHYIDFDANAEVSIKGFKYLPRQDGSPNGTFKGYKLQVSNDGKSWSEPVAQGEFSGNKQQEVIFNKPVKARYVRFTGLSSQNGQDFGSGAEFELIKE
ncbi:MAG: discoidin domain-containing protein [Alistipes sp.]|nr:discoidin domain-containing protein [Alistipes sp.]